MKSNILSFLLGLSVSINAAHAIGAQLETPTIRDMYFGFVMTGLLAKYGCNWSASNEIISTALKITDQMMKARSG